MKRSLFILTLVAIIALASLAFAAEEGQTVKTGIGGLTIGGTYKAGFNYYIGQEKPGDPEWLKVGQAVDRDQDMEFTFNYANITLKGWVVDERVTYAVSFAFKEDGTKLDDMKLGFHYIPYTGIYIGRILPEFTYFNGLSPAKFKTIEQPLMNAYIFNRDRQTGLNLGLKTTYLDANLGVYNGRQFFPAFIADGTQDGTTVGNLTWGDQNTGKDIHFGITAKPPLDGLDIRLGLWYGTPLDNFETKDGVKTEHNAAVMFINGGIDYLAPFGLTFVADILYGTYTWDSKMPTDFKADRGDDNSAYTLATMSYYIMAAYNFGPMFEVPVELLVRYDYWDPDTLNDKKKHGPSEDDALTDITVGVNYYIKNYNAMLSMDYINHGEQWEEVTNLKGDDTQTGINNDELRLQAQVAF